GRDPFEEISVADVLPKSHSKFIGNALIAYQAGQTLAGIFYLRVFVEQFWKSLPAIAAQLEKEPRLSGEKMGEIYNMTLPPEFKARFPSLSAIYEQLSESIHKADGQPMIFDKCAQQIVEHFDARRIFKIE
ncbi:MAG TPA: hypothetical protein VMI53_08635, partial [Opitutaceae bacterium]|nr:hypothetical protein [Opitutaceae bacterium]